MTTSAPTASSPGTAPDGLRRVLVAAAPSRVAGIRASLGSLTEGWDVAVLPGGAAALDRLDTAGADVLVASLHMPEMAGTELLQTVRRRHPEVVRIALSDRPDQQAALKLTGIAHQFLTDPCGPDELADVVERAVALRRRLRSPALVELVSGLRSLPSMPALHTEVVHLVMSPDSSLADIGGVISRDPGMSAKVLQLVNSAFFGLRQRITDPTLAVTLLGTNTLITLVLGVHIFTQGQASRGNRDDMDRLFRRAVAAAAASREIAHAERLGRDGMSDHHLAGMLHDVGKLVLATNFPDEYAGISGADDPLQAERRQFGATHEDVGAYLLGLWGLPDPIVEAAAFHHRPGTSPSRALSPLTVVHLVSAVVDAPSGVPPAIDAAYLGEVGVAHRVDAWMASAESTLGSA